MCFRVLGLPSKVCNSIGGRRMSQSVASICRIFYICLLIVQPFPVIAQTTATDFGKSISRAEKGDVQAYEGAGLDYFHGSNGAPQDYAKALFWFRKAVNNGNSSAAQMLGEMYGRGLGVPQDSELAAKWYRMAAEHGIPFAAESADLFEHITVEGRLEQRRLGELERAFTILNPFQDPAFDASIEDRKQAFAVIQKAAMEGLAGAQSTIAFIYDDPVFADQLGVGFDQSKATEFYLAAAEQHDPDAMVAIAKRYEHGIGFAKDTDKALMWYREVAKLPFNRFSHLTGLAGCKIDFLEDGMLDNRNCETWTSTHQARNGLRDDEPHLDQ